MQEILVILGLPAMIALMAITFVFALGTMGEVPSVVDSRTPVATQPTGESTQ